MHLGDRKLRPPVVTSCDHLLRLPAATFCGHGDCPSSDQFQYGNVKDKVLAEEEDRFIVCMTHQLGYGLWKELPC